MRTAILMLSAALFASSIGLASARQGPADSAAPVAVNDAVITSTAFPERLSEYDLFANIRARTPAARVMRYELNTPLFSDYAEKERFIYVPAGKRATYQAEAVLTLPVGSAIIKTFGYREAGVLKPIETRLLLRRASGWVALPYVWTEDGSDAVLARAGRRLAVTFTDPAGRPRSISYAVPNQNQCKECHALGQAITPIGPTARNLNDGRQLQAMLAAAMIDRVPADAPRLARWDDTKAPLESRARAYLEVNCAHCHNRAGSASNSGLFLLANEQDETARGLLKRPVAAGRGSGGLDFAIAPGDPARSILIHRMKSVEPGVAMPEVGRGTVHDEGVALISRWIASMPARTG